MQLEQEIQKSLELLISTRTAFIISHRLSTIRNADRIIVLQAGRIVERAHMMNCTAAEVNTPNCILYFYRMIRAGMEHKAPDVLVYNSLLLLAAVVFAPLPVLLTLLNSSRRRRFIERCALAYTDSLSGFQRAPSGYTRSRSEK